MFVFRLALALRCTVSELLIRVSSRELAEWQAYARLEPFGERHADLRSAIVAATMANVWRAPNSRPYSADLFMPKVEADGEMDADQMLAALQSAFGGGE